MKVAHISAVFQNNGGGTGKACYNLVKKLADSKDMNLTIFLPSSQKQTMTVEKELKIEYVRSVYSWGNAALVPDLVDKLKGFDLIHLHYPFYGGAEFAVRAARKYHIPYVITYHTETVFNSFIMNMILEIYNRTYLKYIIADADLIIGVTKTHLYHSNIICFIADRHRIKMISNAVDDNFINAPIRRLRTSTKNKRIGFCSNLDKAHYYKGLGRVIDAISVLNNDHELFIAGAGDLIDSYKNKAKQLGVDGQCHFLGNLEGNSLVKFYDNIDLLVSPSEIPESFLISNLEALSRGKKIITTDWPATRELKKYFPDNLYHLLKKNDDLSKIINKCLASSPSSHETADAIKTIKNNFNWQSVADSTIEQYNKILQNHHDR